MFLRRNRKRYKGDIYEYWTLVESVRTERGPRQRTVASLGKLPGLDPDDRMGWEDITRMLDGKSEDDRQPDLFENKKPSSECWKEVDLSGVRVERVREFGKVYLALALWRRMKFHKFFKEHLPRGREMVDWSTVICALGLGRFCDQGSELALSERWYAHTALDDLLGVDAASIYDNRLYRGLDRLIPLREKLFSHLRERYETMFGASFEFLLYDVTSTYFEGACESNPQAQRGYSRDKRPDCKQVCIGLVVTSDGLPLAYEVFDGNTADVTTVEEIIDLMERKYGRAQRIWAMDRGMVSEDNLDYLRDREALYIVGTPKGRLRQFEKELLDEKDWLDINPAGVKVKLVDHPDSNGQERYIICRSAARHEKEAAMFRLQRDRLREKLESMQISIKKRRHKAETIERRIGRWMGRNTIAEKLFTVRVLSDEGYATDLQITEHEGKLDWARAAQGTYLLRTNCTEEDPEKLWRWYIHLTEVEDAFRTSKSDLGMRPVYHQKQHRVQAHILICFLSLVMWRSLEMWLKSKGLGNCCRQVLDELATVKSMDVVLPVRGDREIRLRTVSKPETLAEDLLTRMELKMPARPKIIKNVVEKN